MRKLHFVRPVSFSPRLPSSVSTSTVSLRSLRYGYLFLFRFTRPPSQLVSPPMAAPAVPQHGPSRPKATNTRDGARQGLVRPYSGNLAGNMHRGARIDPRFAFLW